MTAFTDKLDRAAGATTCDVLKIGGGALFSAGVWGVAAGGAGFGPMGLGAAALLAANYVCEEPWDPNITPPGGPENVFGCIEKAPGTSNAVVRSPCSYPADGPEYVEYCSIKSNGVSAIRSVIETPVGGNPPLSDYTVVVTLSDGSTEVIGGPRFRFESGTSFSLYGPGACVNEVGPEPDFPPVPPYQFIDVDGCQLTVTFQGFAGTPGGVGPVYKIEGNAPNLRADGDDLPVVGDCNFYPTLYFGDPAGGPPYVGPWDPDWDGPDQPPFPWGEKLDEIAKGVEGALTEDAFDEVFDKKMDAITYRLDSICEVDAQGNPVSSNVEVSIPALDPFSALAARLDALVPLLQGQKDFKQPICSSVKLQGEFRTIGFISENYSPNGRNYLRKRLRYRSLSGIGLDALIDHWKDFQFDAGPVTVKHRGASWGTITVWAASAAEGKRVIRHAAGEAGIDADQAGRWEISGSSSSRLGMPGRMRVNNKGGFYWITERDGAMGRPTVGEVTLDLIGRGLTQVGKTPHN